MVYYIGDIHGSKYEVTRFCKRMNLTRSDTIVLLGDVGANYYGNERDLELKRGLARLKPTFLCIHSNHEMRPASLPGYITKIWNGGSVWYEEEYPNILFARDGEIFELNGAKHLVIGGAYSVDKWYRLHHGYGWWEDEQPSAEIKAYVEKQIQAHPIDIVLSHTCPYKYRPIEAFLPMIDQDTVDESTEEWLDSIEESLDYKAWLCGHWHNDKRIDRMHFLYHQFEALDQIVRSSSDE